MESEVRESRPIPQIAIVVVQPKATALTQPGSPIASIDIGDTQATINAALIQISAVAADPEKIETTVHFTPMGVIAVIKWWEFPALPLIDGEPEFVPGSVDAGEEDLEAYLLASEGGEDERS